MEIYWNDIWESWRKPHHRLMSSKQDIDEHLAEMEAFTKTPINKEINDWLVTNLDTLDRKAQGQLLLTAVVLAIAAVLYPTIAKDLGDWGIGAITFVMGILIYSCISLALLNVVYWTSTTEFRNSATRFTRATSSGEARPLDLFSHMVIVREKRTMIIWRCGLLDIISLVFIFLLLLAELFKVAGVF